MEVSRDNGLDVTAFTRSSDDLPANILGRLQAGIGAISPSTGLAELESRLDEFQPDLIHLWDHFPLISPWIAPLSERRRIPIILHCVHYRLTCPIATHYTRGEVCTRCTRGREQWAVLRNCRGNLAESVTVALHNAVTRIFEPFSQHITRFIAPCEFTRQWLIREGGLDATRVQTVMPFVDLPLNAVDPAQGEYVAYAGRFVKEKGIHTLLEAAQLSGLPVRLSRDKAYPVEIPLPSSAREVITSSHIELKEFYRGARMLVVPSEWFETFGLVGAEAMSHGIPVIASNIGALSDLVDHERNGLLFEPGNGRQLADAMTRLWTDNDLCRRLGTAARQKVKSMWTVDHYVERLLQVYQDALSAL